MKFVDKGVVFDTIYQKETLANKWTYEAVNK